MIIIFDFMPPRIRSAGKLNLEYEREKTKNMKNNGAIGDNKWWKKKYRMDS